MFNLLLYLSSSSSSSSNTTTTATMYILTRRPARIGMGDGIHIIGINVMPRITIWDTLTIKGIFVIVVRICPTINSLVTELIAGIEGITFAHLGSSIVPIKSTSRGMTSEDYYVDDDEESDDDEFDDDDYASNYGGTTNYAGISAMDRAKQTIARYRDGRRGGGASSVLQQVPFPLQAGLIYPPYPSLLVEKFRIGRRLDRSSCCLCGCCLDFVQLSV